MKRYANITHLALISLSLGLGFSTTLCAAEVGRNPSQNQAPANSANYGNGQFCANENEQCEFSGVRVVAYGAFGRYKYKVVDKHIPCNNAIFGDPIPGTRKQCSYGNQVLQRCADEGGYCQVTGNAVVSYGAGTNFVGRKVSGGTPCTNAVFGDPAPNVGKACYIK